MYEPLGWEGDARVHFHLISCPIWGHYHITRMYCIVWLNICIVERERKWKRRRGARHQSDFIKILGTVILVFVSTILYLYKTTSLKYVYINESAENNSFSGLTFSPAYFTFQSGERVRPENKLFSTLSFMYWLIKNLIMCLEKHRKVSKKITLVCWHDTYK